MTCSQYPQTLIDNVCFETVENTSLYPTIHIGPAKEGHLVEPRYVSLIFDWYLGVRPTEKYESAMAKAIEVLLSYNFLASRKTSTICRYEKRPGVSNPPTSLWGLGSSSLVQKYSNFMMLTRVNSSRRAAIEDSGFIINRIAQVVEKMTDIGHGSNVRIELVVFEYNLMLSIYSYTSESNPDENKTPDAENKEESDMSQRMKAHLDGKVPPGLAQWVGDQFDTQMRSGKLLDLYVDVITNNFNQFVAECVDENGQPKTPSKKALMKARSMLPERYSMSLSKPKSTQD